MKGMLENMEKGINTEVVLEDELIILDIIDYINFEMKDKFGIRPGRLLGKDV